MKHASCGLQNQEGSHSQRDSLAACLGGNTYRLDLPETWKIHNVFHASLLTPYHEMAEHGPNYLQPPPDIIDDAPEWEVEKIIKTHTFGHWKKKQYLVRWKGYSPAHDSWVNSKDMHAEDLISDFEKDTSTVIKAAVACQEATMPLVPYFPPFLSIYAASTRLPGSLNIEDDDNKSDQGYSDEDQPMSPEAYDPEDPLTPTGPPTPTAEDQPSRLIAYDIYPGGGWGQTSRWPGVPITPLSEITPNPEPWPYPPERYRSPVPTGALPYSMESSPALPEALLPSPPYNDTPSPPIYLSTDPLLSPVCQDAPGQKVLLYPQPRNIKPLL